MISRGIFNKLFRMKHHNKSILVVSINEAEVEQISQVLLKEGYNFFRTSSGKEALNLAKRYKPDLIIIDFEALDIEKKEFCNEFKGNFPSKDTLILALKSPKSEDSVVESFEFGVDSFLIKPFTKALLIIEIKRLLKEQSKYNSGQN